MVLINCYEIMPLSCFLELARMFFILFGNEPAPMLAVMQSLLKPDELKVANRFRRLWSLYQQNIDLIQVGAYEAGSNPDLDEAIRLRPAMEHFLRQDMHLGEDESSSRQGLLRVISGH